VKIFLDENLPRKLVAVLRAEGHDVESVQTLRLQGLANGKLYEFAKRVLTFALLATAVLRTLFGEHQDQHG
jgi:hypothetical protein